VQALADFGLIDDCYVTAYLRYVEGCDDGYEPPGFERTLENELVFPVGNGWAKHTEDFASASGCFHK